MFAESLLESAGSQHTHRGWTTAASITLQAAVLSLFVLVPLIYPNALSIARPETISIPMFSPAPAPVPVTQDTPHPQAGPAATINAPFVRANDSTLHFGSHAIADEGPAAPSLTHTLPGDSLILGSAHGPQVRLSPPAPPTKPVPISHMDEGSLIYNLKPTYPRIAVESRTEGTVILHAIISRTGTIESLQVVSGHPFLAHAAVDAVRQWRYRPYILNGEAVEVDTQITVNFRLGGN